MRTALPSDASRSWCGNFFAGARSGFFVEVGANRPRQESQTWHLEQLGWTGVLIEPQPDLAAELWRMRSRQGIRGCLLVAAERRPTHAPARRRRVVVARPRPHGAGRRARARHRGSGAHPRRHLDRGAGAGAVRSSVDRRRRPRARGARRLRSRALAPAARSCSRITSAISSRHRYLERRRLSPDPPLSRTTAGMFRAMRRSRSGRASAGRSCASIISRCRSASRATRRGRAPADQGLAGLLAASRSVRVFAAAMERSCNAGATAAATARSAAAPSSASPRSAWRSGRTCLRNSRAR